MVLFFPIEQLFLKVVHMWISQSGYCISQKSLSSVPSVNTKRAVQIDGRVSSAGVRFQ